MKSIDPTLLKTKIILLLPVIICFFVAYGIKKTNGNIVAGFNAMSTEDRNRLIEHGFLKKIIVLTLSLAIPFLVIFLLSFFIKNSDIFNKLIMLAWGVFCIVLLLGIVIINKTV